MEFERTRRQHSHINVAPMVDIVFLLLLFFMLTSRLIEEPHIKVKLPASKTSEAHAETIRTLLVTAKGDVYLGETRVGLDGLGAALRTNPPDKDSLQIKADKEVSVGLLVKVIDEVRLAGVKSFNIVTERR